MGRMTGIEWTDATWNPVTGCSKVSPGCKFCYAERIFQRPYPGRDFTDVQIHPERLYWPLRWRGAKQAKAERRPSRIFVNSMSDLFHEKVYEEFTRMAFRVMGEAEQHVFQVLTKRPKRMMSILKAMEDEGDFATLTGRGDMFPFKNVWLGVSTENQEAANERIPLLLHTPAAVRFISYEPALGPVDFSPWLTADDDEERVGGGHPIPAIDWLIAGGESGPNARPSHPDWFRDVRDQCQEAGVPFFMKQWGEWTPKGNESIAAWNRSTSHALVNIDGEYTKVDGPDDPDEEFGLRCCDLDGNDGAAAMAKVGKKSAGRLLDGREWNEFPK